MVVATFDKTDNQLINSTCMAFNEPVIYIKNIIELEQFNDVVFCVEKQIIDELKNHQVEELRTYSHSSDCCYVFGRNSNFNLAKYIQEYKFPYTLLTIADSRVLWSEAAMAIVLYDRYRKEIE